MWTPIMLFIDAQVSENIRTINLCWQWLREAFLMQSFNFIYKANIISVQEDRRERCLLNWKKKIKKTRKLTNDEQTANESTEHSIIIK